MGRVVKKNALGKANSRRRYSPSRKIISEGKGILVFDDIFEWKIVEKLFLFLYACDFKKRPSFDNEFSAPVLANDLMECCDILLIMEDLIKRYYSKISIKKLSKRSPISTPRQLSSEIPRGYI